MKTRLAINGFGRIGRNLFKVAFERSDIEIVAVNDPADSAELAYLLKHDSTYGTYQHQVEHDGGTIIVNGTPVKVLHQVAAGNITWQDYDIDVVVETGEADEYILSPQKHIEAGARRVILTAVDESDTTKTLIMGVNEETIAGDVQIVSGGSGAANAMVPVMAVLDAAIGIDKAMASIVHSYTANQQLVDGRAADYRISRNAAQNIVPVASDAAIAVASVLPTIKAGNFGALELHVPTQVVAVADIALVFKRATTVEELNESLARAASEPYYQGILAVTTEALVSSDYIGNSHSAVVDASLTQVVGGTLGKVVVWYDNEWGYSNRLAEIIADIGRQA